MHMERSGRLRGSGGLGHGSRTALSPRTLAILAAGTVLCLIFWMVKESPTSSSSSNTLAGNAPGMLSGVDMHAHSSESDGDTTVRQQIDAAKALGLHSIWITDHDMIRPVAATRALQDYARQAGVRVGFGVEITVSWEEKEHHLLGYFPDAVWADTSLSPAMVKLQAACAEVKSSRETRNKQLVAFLNTMLSGPQGSIYMKPGAQKFTPFTVDQVSVWAQQNAGLVEPSSLGRPHFSKFLMNHVGVREDLVFGPRAGTGRAVLTPDNKVVFDPPNKTAGTPVEALMHSATLARRKIAFEPLPIVEAITLINAAHGRAVVAHIPTLGPQWYERFAEKLADLKAAGLWGIEAFSSEISATDHNRIHSLATRLGLRMTGGSDNHGSLKKYAKLGQVHRAGDVAYSELEAWAAGGASESDALQKDTDL
eukprot:m.177123 g.177123  ORF g.177123 m.177123 type:complete len:424 (-) comp17374_c1_seq1:355-1626(-)